MTRRARLLLVAGMTVAAVAGVFSYPPVPQSQAYHRFADPRALVGIPSFLNVVSNAAFVLVGVLGLGFLRRDRLSNPRGASIRRSEQWSYLVLFLGVALAGLGSAHYHLSPDNVRLAWDRAPMTLAFMGLLGAVIAERVHVRAGLVILTVLVALGMGSVLYWHVSELRGVGDLRPYILVQYYPGLAIPVIVYLFPSRYTRSADLLVAITIYLVAKAFEVLDGTIFAFGGIVSGHTLKHLTAALATYVILRMLQERHPIPAKHVA